MDYHTLETAKALGRFTHKILHGDDAHKLWLLTALEEFIETDTVISKPPNSSTAPVPPPSPSHHVLPTSRWCMTGLKTGNGLQCPHCPAHGTVHVMPYGATAKDAHRWYFCSACSAVSQPLEPGDPR